MAIPAGVLDRTKQFEGNIPFIYLDSVGKPTTGVGHALASADDAALLPFAKNADGQGATDAEKKAEWGMIDQQDFPHIASFYQPFTSMSLRQGDIDVIATADLESTAAELKARFADYDTFPDSAQAGLIDMGFNLGVPNLISKFPNFVAAIRIHDWQNAANECHRQGVQDARNVQVAQLFQQAANL